jgi:hypothetical protein
MIASLGMPESMKANDVMIDHIEFLKTAFVMVIAFYFGSKSPEILRDGKGGAGKEKNGFPNMPMAKEGSENGDGLIESDK